MKFTVLPTNKCMNDVSSIVFICIYICLVHLMNERYKYDSVNLVAHQFDFEKRTRSVNKKIFKKKLSVTEKSHKK